MRRLPRWAQPALTLLTGKAHWGQASMWRSNGLGHVVMALAGLIGGAVGAASLFSVGPVAWIGIIPCWLLVVGSARKIQVTLAHQCAHYALTGNRLLDRWIGQALTTLIVVDHFDSYYHEHVEIHHTKKLASSVDPDCKFLLELGFRPGMSVASLWSLLRWTIVSPSFHWKFLKARLMANFVTAPLARRVGAGLFQLTVAGVVTYVGGWTGFVVGWVLPLTAPYHIAALLNFSSLHFWLRVPTPGANAKETICTLTAGRFVGEAVPETDSWLAWMKWSARMAFVHLPVRVAVLTGDLPVHDYHHRHARCPEWAEYLYTRQRDIENGCPGWPLPYAENWGLGNAIQAVFETISRAPAMGDGARLTEGESLQTIIHM